MQVSQLVCTLGDEQKQSVIPRAGDAVEHEIKRGKTSRNVFHVTQQRPISIFTRKRKHESQMRGNGAGETVEAKPDAFYRPHVLGRRHNHYGKLAHRDRLA